MPRLHINGEAVAIYLKRRQVEADRLTPLTFSLSEDLQRDIVGISPYDAWLPLAISLVARMDQLWSVITKQPQPRSHVAGGEHLYLVLHASLDAMLPGEPYLAAIREVVSDRIPDALPPTSSLNDTYHVGGEWPRDAFEEVRSRLLQVGVRRRINPDPRTVENVLLPYDRAFDRVRLAVYELLQARADALELTGEERNDLAQSLTDARRRVEFGSSSPLAIAMEVLLRIEEIWELLFGDSDELLRVPDDESTYQAYRGLLLRVLDADPAHHEVRDLARRMLPRRLPAEVGLEPTHPDLVEMAARMDELRTEITGLAAWLDEPFLLDHSREADLDDRYEQQFWEWLALQDTVEQLQAPRRPARTIAVDIDTGKTKGAPRKDVAYEDVARIWWQIRDRKSRGNPTYVDLAAELSTPAQSISPKTVQRRRAQWKLERRPWPPERPKGS